LDHAAVRRIRETAEALRGEPRPPGAVMLTGDWIHYWMC
jgi:hypothetical protein